MSTQNEGTWTDPNVPGKSSNTFSDTMRSNTPEKAKIMSDAYDRGLERQEALTQNDIKEEKKRKEILYGICMAMTFDQFDTFMNNLESEKEKELADAGREVIKRIEAIPDKDVRPEITVWLESREFCLGYNEALKDVLATLKEETK